MASEVCLEMITELMDQIQNMAGGSVMEWLVVPRPDQGSLPILQRMWDGTWLIGVEFTMSGECLQSGLGS